MNKIIKGLFLGGYDDAKDAELLHQNNITHILTVHELQLSSNYRKDFQYMFIETKSYGEIDLLSHFTKTNEFISSAIQSGCVLVHCQFGMSRSSTIVIAYIMFINKCSFESAFEIVKNKRRVISPTDSFIYQMRLFEHMQFNLDISYQIFRLYKNYFTIANRLGNNELVMANVDTTLDNYKCSKCKFDLFSDDNLNLHLSEESDIDLQLSYFFEIEVDQQKYCSKNRMYVELMEWMNFKTDVKGLLKCPNCNADIGKFCLKGETCNCGKWVFPAILMDKDSVNK